MVMVSRHRKRSTIQTPETLAFASRPSSAYRRERLASNDDYVERVFFVGSDSSLLVRRLEIDQPRHDFDASGCGEIHSYADLGSPGHVEAGDLDNVSAAPCMIDAPRSGFVMEEFADGGFELARECRAILPA